MISLEYVARLVPLSHLDVGVAYVRLTRDTFR